MIKKYLHLSIDKFLDIEFENKYTNNLKFEFFFEKGDVFKKKTFSSFSLFLSSLRHATLQYSIYAVLYDNNCVSSNNNIAHNLDSHSSS